MITAEESRSDENVEATENAISAMGKIVMFHAGQDVTFFMANLPLTNDQEEAQRCHKLFMEQVIAKNGNLWAKETELKAALVRIKECENEEVLCEEGKKLLQSLVWVFIKWMVI